MTLTVFINIHRRNNSKGIIEIFIEILFTFFFVEIQNWQEEI